MNQKTTWVLVIVIIVIVLIAILSSKGKSSVSDTTATVPKSTDNVLPPRNEEQMSNTTSTANQAKTYVIIYTDDGFLTDTITIDVGDTIVFKNESSRPFWPASNDHPTHRLYPEPGFDADRSIAIGDEWSFTFGRIGSWGYHDHKKPVNMGTIIVK